MKSAKRYVFIAIFILFISSTRADTVVVGDKEWKTPLLSVPVSTWTEAASVCSPDTGECTGTIRGIDLSGWIWASATEVGDLLAKLTLYGGGVDARYTETDSTWAPSFVALFGATLSGGTDSTGASGGFTRTLAGTDSAGNALAYWAEVFDRGQAGGEDSVQIRPAQADQPEAHGTIWLYRSAAIEVHIDFKPMGCPNPLNTMSKGVVPVAILGNEDFDVTRVDPGSVKLSGVSPLRWSYEDVAGPYFGDVSDPYDCHVIGADGFYDLVLKFENQDIVATLGAVTDGDVLTLEIAGNLDSAFDATPIEGSDVVLIVKNHN